MATVTLCNISMTSSVTSLVFNGDIILDHDPGGEVREPKVNMLFRLAVIQERWDEFVQHITDHPEDARQGYLLADSYDWDAESMLHPSYLHAFLQSCKE